MPKTLYKGPRLGKLPPCVICVGPGTGPRAQLRLPCGVSVWLCEEHRSEEFQRSRAGRDFSATLSAVWSAGGCLTARRRRALEIHRRGVLQGPATRDLPGSYAWPDLRREAERRFAAGESPAAVMAWIGRATDRPPSRRTVLRWCREARWRASAPTPV